jgi:hypothetical protein
MSCTVTGSPGLYLLAQVFEEQSPTDKQIRLQTRSQATLQGRSGSRIYCVLNEEASEAAGQIWRGNEENEKATETKEKLQIYSIPFS